MIKKNLLNKILKLVSILSIALTMSLMTFSFTAFAFTIAPSTEPKPATPVNFDYKGKGVAGNTIKLTFDSGETFSGKVGTDGIYSLNINYPHTKGRILIEESSTTGLETSRELPYDITKFAASSAGFGVGPVLFSGVGEVPGSTVSIEFEDGSIVTALVDSKGNYSASPIYPLDASTITITTTSVGNAPVVKQDSYLGGITTIAATQVTPPDPTPNPTPTPTPTPTPATTPDSGIKPVATAASTAAKATVRSGGFLQIAGIIALFTVILTILIINKKFKR
jgi:hypothetical protein